jgi:hypothetical protein
MISFIQRHMNKVIGMISGFDRMRFRGTLRMLANVTGLRRFLDYRGHLLKDFGAYVQEVSEEVKAASLAAAAKADRPVVYLQNSDQSKEEVALDIQGRDGVKDGLICVITAVENCGSYRAAGNRQRKLLELSHARRKCLHLYHYIQHPEFGLMHMRLQSWLPLNQFVCINGREWLGRQMDRCGIKYVRRDNCFTWISDVEGAQALLEAQVKFNWQEALGELGRMVNPALGSVIGDYDIDYYWSLEESEWATDIMFHDHRELSRLYPLLIHHGMESLGSRDVLKFLGRRVPAAGISPRLVAEVTSDLKERPEGIRIKHRVNRNSVKMYNKQGSVLRVETTLNNMRDMKSLRKKADGTVVWEKMRKGVSDIARRAEVSQGCNERYLEAMSAVEDTTPLSELTEALSKAVVKGKRRARGLNLLGADDARLLALVGDGKYVIGGFRNGDLQEAWFKGKAADAAEGRRRSGKIGRMLWMLRAHGLVKKVGTTYRYHVTKEGRRVIAALLAARAADTIKLTRAA